MQFTLIYSYLIYCMFVYSLKKTKNFAVNFCLHFSYKQIKFNFLPKSNSN